MDKVTLSDNGCWEFGFKYSPNGKRYGAFNFNGKTVTSSRAAYMLMVGEIPDGLFVLHKCDNTKCVNPEHLFLGTQLDNVRDMIAKGRDNKAMGEKVWTYKNGFYTKENINNRSAAYEKRRNRIKCFTGLPQGEYVAMKQRAKTHCPNGHPYNGDNLLLEKRMDGGIARRCRKCAKIKQQKYLDKKQNEKTKRS